MPHLDGLSSPQPNSPKQSTNQPHKKAPVRQIQYQTNDSKAVGSQQSALQSALNDFRKVHSGSEGKTALGFRPILGEAFETCWIAVLFDF